MKNKKTKKANKANPILKASSPTLPTKFTNSPKEKRIPRPLGVTLLIRDYHKTGNKELLTRARNNIIEQWSNANFHYNGKPTELTEIAKLLNITTQYVIKKIVQPMKNWLTEGTAEERYEALLSLITKMTMATRSQIQAHIGVMVRGQTINKDGQMTYTPFVSGEITKGLKLIVDNDLGLLKIIHDLKPMMPTTAIQINGANSPAQSSMGQYLGVNEAVKILAEKSQANLLDSPDMQNKLLAEHTQDTLPEIIATKQQGVNLDGSSKPLVKRDHSQRREANGQIYSDIIIP